MTSHMTYTNGGKTVKVSGDFTATIIDSAPVMTSIAQIERTQEPESARAERKAWRDANCTDGNRDYGSSERNQWWNELIMRDGAVCQIGGNIYWPQDLAVCHDDPWSEGGSNEIWNLYLGCQYHNSKQGSRMTLAEAKMQDWASEPCSIRGAKKISRKRTIDTQIVPKGMHYCRVCDDSLARDEFYPKDYSKRPYNKCIEHYKRDLYAANAKECYVDGCENEYYAGGKCWEHHPDNQ